MRKIDLTGKKLGRLTAISSFSKNKRTYWFCVCDCGTRIVCDGGSLRSGHSKSCGCLNKERTQNMGKENFRHGHSRTNNTTSEYYTWASLKDRCKNPNSQKWNNYGGRGITVCERWGESFENFLADVGSKPKKDYCIDRINNNGNYEPGNVRWTTCKQNSRNKRVNVLIEIDGRIKCASEWAELIGADSSCVLRRYRKGQRGQDLLRPPHKGKSF